MAQRGGRRPGAGRKPGSVNKNSRKLAVAAAQQGKLPHELLLDIARGDAKVVDYVVDKSTGEEVKIERHATLEERIRAATAAAPFYAPKLQAVAPVVPPNPADNPIKHLMEQVHAAGTNRVRVGK